jgi:CBS domain-containing protein
MADDLPTLPPGDLAAEAEIEAARAAMSMSGIDSVVVIGTAGELLGVLTDGDVRSARRPRHAA